MNQQQGNLPHSQRPTSEPPAQQTLGITSTEQIPGGPPGNNVPTSRLPDNFMPDEEKRELPEGQETQQENGDEIENVLHNIPKTNCPEKIVLCFDLSSELNTILSKYQNQDRSVFMMLRRSVEFFVKHKIALNKKHKIAIMTLDKSTLWVQDFSSDVNLISDTLHNIHPNTTDPPQQFVGVMIFCSPGVVNLEKNKSNSLIRDMTSLFETIENYVELPEVEAVDIPPDYVVRLILIYGRSHSDLPMFSPEGKRVFDKYMSCPYFFFDLLYLHELPGDDNQCEAIYEAFCKLDEKEDCFILEVPYAPIRLFESSAKLLAHPLQRPKQQDIDYRINRNNDSSSKELEPE